MSVSGYSMVSQVRYRELKTRLALAVFIGVTAWFISPGMVPLIWLGLVAVTQAIDYVVFRPYRLEPSRTPTLPQLVLACLTTSISVAVYSAIAAYLWFAGGQIGQIFALVQIAGGLLHVSLHMHHVRPILFAAVIPHGAYFLALPLVSAVITGQWQQALVAIACCLYMSHLVVAVRQSSATTASLKEARDAARDAQAKAEVANAAKSDFLAVISHEIRTPMNAVISAANLLRRTRLDTQQREHVSMLIDAGDVLMGLLNDVLDFSKIEAGKMQLERADVAVRERVAAVIRLWEPRALANGVRLRAYVDDTVPAVVRTDPLRFQQILFNLISNAVKFTEQGRIDVRVDWLDGRLSVAVQDTGCGIAAERLSGVFNGFEQAEAGTTRRYGGTGLGLSISRKLAELMGGDLSVTSLVDKGSTFTLSLPVDVASAPVAARVRSEEDHSVLRGVRILAADDHEVNRRILRLLLEPFDCRLTLVENGAEALEAARDQAFDVLLMDMQMPVMDGLEATRQIRLGGANANTPVIALTANAMDLHRAAWAAAGVHTFLTKPIDPQALVGALAEAYATRQASALDTLAVAG